MNQKSEGRIKTGLLLAAMFLFLLRTKYYWQKLGGLVLPIVMTLLAFLFITILIKLLFALVRIVKHRTNLSRKVFLPALIYSYAIVDGLFNPFNINLEKLQSEVSIRACYEGTMNTATLKFREDRTFELQMIGFFAASEFYEGAWKSEGDTISLSFAGTRPTWVGEIFIIANGRLLPIETGEGKKKGAAFYLGYCRGEN